MPQLNEGARALAATNETLAVIARACKVSRSAVSRWKRGLSVPVDDARKRLHKAFDIAPDAWGEARSHGTPSHKKSAKKRGSPSAADYPEPPADDVSIVDHVRYSLKCLRHELRFGELTPSSQAKLRSDEARTLGLIAKLQREEELSQDRYVKNHPAFREHCDRILAVLKPYPKASRAVVEAMRGNT